MKPIQTLRSEEQGFVLVTSLMLIALISLAGISAVDISTSEIQTATNDVHHKITFYSAEGGLDVGCEMLEQNICCPTGFTPDEAGGDEATISNIRVMELAFWKNSAALEPSDMSRDLYFPFDYGAGTHTNLGIGGSTVQGIGSALQMAAGYEGKGKGAAGGGAYLLYDIHSQHLGRGNSLSEVKIQWRHMIGQEEACRY